MSVESANLPNSVGNNQDIYSWQNYAANHSETPKRSSKRKKIIALIVVGVITLGVGGYFGIKGIDSAMKEKHRVETTAEKKLYRTADGERTADISSKIPDMVYEGKTNDEIISYLDNEITNTSDQGMKTYIKAIKGSFIVGYVDIDSGIEYLKQIENESDESYVKEAIYSRLASAYKAKGDSSMSDYFDNVAGKYR